MKASPLLVAWHDNTDPIYSAHFEPHGKGRLATAGGDCHVRVSIMSCFQYLLPVLIQCLSYGILKPLAMNGK
jgi:hypothetical protein